MVDIIEEDCVEFNTLFQNDTLFGDDKSNIQQKKTENLKEEPALNLFNHQHPLPLPTTITQKDQQPEGANEKSDYLSPVTYLMSTELFHPADLDKAYPPDYKKA